MAYNPAGTARSILFRAACEIKACVTATCTINSLRKKNYSEVLSVIAGTNLRKNIVLGESSGDITSTFQTIMLWKPDV